MISLTIAVLLAMGETSSAVDVPDFIHICKRNDPDINDCLVESIKNIRPHLLVGIPEFNIPPIEPMHLGDLTAVQRGAIKVSGKDIYVYGGSDFRISNLNSNIETLVTTANVFQSSFYVEGQYELDGKILLLPLKGSGIMRGNFTESSSKVRIQFEVIKNEEGVEYLQCSDFDLDIDDAKGSIYLGNLFGGEEVLGDVVNSSMNKNFDVFFKELKPLVEKTLSKAFKDIANKILESFTYEQLFPKN